MATEAATRLWVSGAIGLAAGALSGLFGVGGGILIVPGLVLLAGMPQRRAHATSLAAILPIAVSGAAGYGIEGAVDWVAVGLLTVGGIAGAFIGTNLLRRIPERGLRALFAVFLLVAAALLPFQASAHGGDGVGALGAVMLVLVGALAGGLAGLLGVGGGIVMVPGLILLGSVAPAVAKGTSLVAIIPTSLIGTLRNVEARDVDLRTSAAVGAGGVLASFAASLLSVRLDPELSAILFGVLLVAMAVRLLLAARGKPVPGER
jgi:uncharacterized membrane protein YfcA